MKKLLLDTHVFLWLLLGEKRIKKNLEKIITQAAHENTLFLSAISVWEIAMLDKLNRITLHQPFYLWINEALTTPGLQLVSLSVDILCESVALPELLHKDPADRMIIATARVENLTLLTMTKGY